MAKVPEDEIHNSPVFWFVLMESAKNRRDFIAAQHALQRLRQLGVEVSFHRPGRPRRPRKQGGPHHAA